MLSNLFSNKPSATTEQRGDTIIEVLISIAVVSLVLAGAYAITNRNLSTTQDTQEHGQALLLVQQQIEGLRALSAANVDLATTFPISSATPNCVNLTGTPAAASGAPCSMASDGSACGNAACYTVAITQPSSGVYEVKASWDSVIGDKAQVSMDYGI